MYATPGDLPRRTVVDAGPLIALLDRREPEHAFASESIRQLIRAGTRVVAPLPIVFEVFKWLVQETNPAAARRGLQRMREDLEITNPGPVELGEIMTVLGRMPTWQGTLEDALVAVTGLWLDAPVWTLNYRDLAAFPNLHFWTPGAS